MVNFLGRETLPGHLRRLCLQIVPLIPAKLILASGRKEQNTRPTQPSHRLDSGVRRCDVNEYTEGIGSGVKLAGHCTVRYILI